MGALDGLLDQVKKVITQHSTNGSGKLDAGSLIGAVTDLFSTHPHNTPGGPKPASQDPYGDPGDAQGRGTGNVKPASQDPYGDPGKA